MSNLSSGREKILKFLEEHTVSIEARCPTTSTETLRVRRAISSFSKSFLTSRLDRR